MGNQNKPEGQRPLFFGLVSNAGVRRPEKWKEGEAHERNRDYSTPADRRAADFFDTVDYRTPHVHEEFELIWLMEGRLSVQAGPFRHVAQSGEMVLFDPQQTHEFHKVEESCTFLCLQVAPTMLAGCFPAIRNIRTGGVCPGIYLSPDVLRRCSAAC